MLTQEIQHPALGKDDEFRALLRERVTSQNDRGVDALAGCTHDGRTRRS